MALRTIPIAIGHARIVERLAPDAWINSFTNPAGIITQAIRPLPGEGDRNMRYAGRVISPIARALQEPTQDVTFEYFGRNHLGWVKAVRVRAVNQMERLLEDNRLLSMLYPTELFNADFLRALGLIPAEYLYFYSNQQLAKANQDRSGATRREELETFNQQV